MIHLQIDGERYPIAAGETGTINVSASDPEGLTTTLTATSSDQTLVRNAGVAM